ncbi:MAG: DUF3299 domain-containing protein [Limisphaerales bacterium]
MNRRNRGLLRKCLDPLGLVGVGFLLAACGPSSETPESKTSLSSSETPSEIRGDPIQGEPIAPPPVDDATASTARETAVAKIEKVGEVEREASVAGAAKAAPDQVGGAGEKEVSAGGGVSASATQSSQPRDGAVPPTAAAETQTRVGTSAHPLAVGFDRLASFSYTLPEGPVDTNVVTQAASTNQIPATVHALNDQYISLKGFMLPLKVEKGLVTELLIMRDQSMCCYGTVPKINEWVSVKMTGDGVKPVMDQAVTLFGKLKVGEMYENGYLVGIYALDGERMAGPLDF